jgi:hypothetical protein
MPASGSRHSPSSFIRSLHERRTKYLLPSRPAPRIATEPTSGPRCVGLEEARLTNITAMDASGRAGWIGNEERSLIPPASAARGLCYSGIRDALVSHAQGTGDSTALDAGQSVVMAGLL